MASGGLVSDEIVVMRNASIAQIGTPRQLYDAPADRFVADFIGSITSFPATVVERASAQLRLSVPALGGDVLARDVPGLKEGQEATLAIRPEKLHISKERPEGTNAYQGTVKDLAYFGKDSLYRVVLPSGALVQAHAVNASRGGEATRAADWDDRVWISFDPSSAIVLTE